MVRAELTEVQSNSRMTHRDLLMCPPDHFDVVYSINPWMEPSRRTDRELALSQWHAIAARYRELGHAVRFIDPVPGLPDMVFAANAALVVNGRVLLSRFRHPERSAEVAHFRALLESIGFKDICQAQHINEGEGDFVYLDDATILAGYGFRTELDAHSEVAHWCDSEIISLRLVDPRFYHLDTALMTLGSQNIAWYPGAFDADSQAILRGRFPESVIANHEDAVGFGLNGFCDGENVVMSDDAPHLSQALRRAGFSVHESPTSELRLAGGSVKCCTLELR
jgi:N-dimethylarginine dimethylaminohydrolase